MNLIKLISAILLAASLAQAPQQDAPGIIEGTVVRTDRNLPLEGISIIDPRDRSRTVVTDMNGNFIMTGVSPGRVVLRAQKPRIWPAETGLECVGFYDTQCETR